jgi:hypothetical protein
VGDIENQELANAEQNLRTEWANLEKAAAEFLSGVEASWPAFIEGMAKTQVVRNPELAKAAGAENVQAFKARVKNAAAAGAKVARDYFNKPEVLPHLKGRDEMQSGYMGDMKRRLSDALRSATALIGKEIVQYGLVPKVDGGWRSDGGKVIYAHSIDAPGALVVLGQAYADAFKRTAAARTKEREARTRRDRADASDLWGD